MTEICRLLEWDTAFFGIRIAQVQVDSLTSEGVSLIEQWCCENQIRCLYFLARADDAVTTHLAEDNSFHLVDVRLTLEQKLTAIRPEANQTRLAKADDLPALKSVARESYHDTRFYFDANFPRALCDAFYEMWVVRSCEGYADTVLVADWESQPAGYVSCHLDRDSAAGKIGLVGVSRHAQGRGVGQMLVHGALSWFLNHGAQTVSIATQARNVAAQRLYQRCGFLTAAINLWYHKWFS